MYLQDDLEFDQRSRWIRCLNKYMCCCVPKSKEISLLIGGTFLPRFLHALHRYHPWIWFFSEGSLVTTRVIRFVITFKFIMTSVFITTVLYGIYYPTTNICPDFNNNASECAAVPSKVLTGESMCSYNPLTGECSLVPPPDSPAFLVTVAFLTVLLMVPFNMAFSFVLTQFCSKRPRVEAFGFDAFHMLGSADPTPNKLAIDAAEQSERVVAVTRSLHGALFHYIERKAANWCTPDEIEGMNAVLRKLGLIIKENKVELTLLSKLRWTDVSQCIRYHVEKSLESACEILVNMQRYSGDAQKESYLIQHFLISRFSFVHRVSLYRHFAHRARDFPLPIHPVIWLLAWLFIVASLMFFVVWILQWGTAHAHGTTIKNWGLNFLLSNAQDVLIFSVARIFFINVLAIETIRPSLVRINNYLIAKVAENATRTSTQREDEENGIFKLNQYLEPPLWAAKLAGSQALSAINDADLTKLAKGSDVVSTHDMDRDDERSEERFTL